MSPYQYPDFEDDLIIRFLEEFEKSDPYWELSERAILNRIFDHMTHKEGFSFNHYLDAGCGRGRLLWVFRKHFGLITAIEPDEARWSDSLKMAEEFGIKDKTRLLNVSAEDFRSAERFDLILSSHVIQHIHTDMVIPMMVNLRNHLAEHGVIAITTCHSTAEHDQYGNNYLRNEAPVREPIQQEEFNHLVYGKGMLPVHYFNAEKLMTDLNEIGLKTIDFRVFHIAREDRDQFQIPDIDNHVNSDSDLQKRYGVDMFLLLEKA